MTRIAHTADVHIRALSRHDEYRHVLASFVETSRSMGVDHFFVVGDIFHTKTSGLSPEYIDILTWWLRSMASCGTVHLMLGNHDGNLVNLSRQDAVSPIVSALNDDRIRLYKKSGTYRMDDLVDLAIFSPFDEDGWKDVVPTPGKVNVAGFHGAVRNSQAESDWAVEEGVDTSFFEDYDIVMLGDIHKSQVLRRTNGRPSMVYPGTPIQQNYGEDAARSFVFWEVRGKDDWSASFIDLPNPCPFVTVDWEGGVSKVVEMVESVPPGARVRIRSTDPLTHDEAHTVSELVRTRASASEVVFKAEKSKFDVTMLAAGDTVVSKTDLRSPDVISSLVHEFHSDMSERDDVRKRIGTYLVATKKTDDVSRGTKWSIDTLEWDNLFSYGEGNQIDFRRLSGIVGVFGPNRIGKSSFVGSIMYTFFNTSDRGAMKNSLICNVRKDSCKGAAKFSIDGVDHLVERQTVKSLNRKGVLNATTSLNLFRQSNGEYVDMCGEQRNDTEKTLRSIIGTSEDFLVTSVSSQGDPNDFISLGPSKRRSLLSRFLDLDVFDMLYDVASRDLSFVKNGLKAYPEMDWDAEETALVDSIEAEKASLERTHEAIQAIQERLTESSMALSTLTGINAVDIDSLEERVVSLTDCLKKTRAARSQLEEELRCAEDVLESLRPFVLDDETVASLQGLRDTCDDLAAQVKDLQRRRETNVSEEKRRSKTMRILDEVPCGDSFLSCKFIKDAIDLRSTSEAWKRSCEELDESITEVTERLDKFQRLHGDVNARLTTHHKNEVSYERKRADVSSIETRLDRARGQAIARESDLRDALEDLRRGRMTQDKSVLERRTYLESEVDRLTQEVMTAMSLVTRKATSIGKLERDLEDVRRRRKERDALLEEARILGRLTTAFSKKGVPLLVTRSQLPAINLAVSTVLQGTVDFDVSLEVDDETDTLEIVLDYGDSRRYIEMCSGMEKTMASLAVRVGLSKVTSLPKPDFFVIDEGFGTLDAAGVESCNRFLTSLKRHFKTVFVITHVDGIKDCADHILEITRNEKDSCLVAI